jgi:hypothetical protein
MAGRMWGEAYRTLSRFALGVLGGCKGQKPPPQTQAVREVALPKGQVQKINGLLAEIDSAQIEADDLTDRAEKETNPTEKAALLGKAALRRAEQRVREREWKELIP